METLGFIRCNLFQFCFINFVSNSNSINIKSGIFQQSQFGIQFTTVSCGTISNDQNNFWHIIAYPTLSLKLLTKVRFFPKISILPKISIFIQNFDFYPKFRFLAKISIFTQNLDFYPKFRYLPKISIFTQNFDFYPKFRFLTQICV